MNFTEAEGYIEIPLDVSFDSHMHCTCLVTVYLGYGVEIQVSTVSSKAFIICRLGEVSLSHTFVSQGQQSVISICFTLNIEIS